METEAAAGRWIDGWLRAWPVADADAVAKQHDCWNTRAGRVEPPHGWGR